MGILDNFEKGLERAVNGAFAKTFRSGLQPVEIGSALKRELDTKAAVVSRDRILVPNSFVVNLSTSDFQRMSAIGPTLIDDLIEIVQKHATAQSFQFAGGISVKLTEVAKLSTGVLEIVSSTIQRDVTWTPVLDVGGKRYALTASRTVIGRGREADITVDDTGISRKHIEVLWDGHTAEARDLGSTNGSQLNGQAFSRAILEPDSVIQIGRTRVVFRVLAQTHDAVAASLPPMARPLPMDRPAAAARPAHQESSPPSTPSIPDDSPVDQENPQPGGFRWDL
ncbi:FhaA domain-containing protein [Subtercola frigoramans]|uniref:FHA domain-containing protein n=1 Tax=Subtercola frigoramans TaxID=120298 RepID=A0ABS2L9P4_9MICO|nr:DUF3662 and FHA domain-containing protein [Subtercola frigoramans]MBM7473739.1 hypothetical protein [Subtercola frigoramans]